MPGNTITSCAQHILPPFIHWWTILSLWDETILVRFATCNHNWQSHSHSLATENKRHNALTWSPSAGVASPPPDRISPFIKLPGVSFFLLRHKRQTRQSVNAVIAQASPAIFSAAPAPVCAKINRPQSSTALLPPRRAKAEIKKKFPPSETYLFSASSSVGDFFFFAGGGGRSPASASACAMARISRNLWGLARRRRRDGGGEGRGSAALRCCAGGSPRLNGVGRWSSWG